MTPLQPFGHYFRDMAGNQHFHTGATPPSFAHSEITPLYTHPSRGVVDDGMVARAMDADAEEYGASIPASRVRRILEAAALPAVPDGVALIAAERHRQVTAEGWTPEHDDEHTDGAMAQAGGCYALAYALEAQGHGKDSAPTPWPWDATWWKPSPADPVRQLVKAGALIAAEIDRLRRAATPAHDQPEGEG